SAAARRPGSGCRSSPTPPASCRRCRPPPSAPATVRRSSRHPPSSPNRAPCASTTGTPSSTASNPTPAHARHTTSCSTATCASTRARPRSCTSWPPCSAPTDPHPTENTMSYTLPAPVSRPQAAPKTAYLITSGDLRESANVAGWPTQVALEAGVTGVLEGLGWSVIRPFGVDPATGHGFISSPRMGMEIFKSIPVDAPLIVAIANWQYSHHVLAGLRTHQGPILTVANFAGDWPGLVGLLGLNAGLTKMGRDYATTWSVDFTDDWFIDGIREWTETGQIVHDASHVRDLPELPESAEKQLGQALAAELLADKAIIGVFDEGCMGMYNAIFDDELLNTIGIYKERLSQSALYAEMLEVADAEADAAYDWLVDH